MYNPMYYLCGYYEGANTAAVAKNWRIHSGIEQGDTSLCVEMNLALALQMYGVDSLELEMVWDQGHTQAERTGSASSNMISWIYDCMTGSNAGSGEFGTYYKGSGQDSGTDDNTGADSDEDSDEEADDDDTAADESPEVPFADVTAGSYYYNAVVWAYSKEITGGTGPETFSPDSPCTRGQIVTFLWRAMGKPSYTIANPFSDVEEGSQYYDAVLWAYENGITTGTSGTAFSPDSPCTRGQAVTFLWRTAGSPAGGSAEAFSDVEIGSYYYDAVCWAVQKDITNGTSATEFSPSEECTRGHIVTFLFRAADELSA